MELVYGRDIFRRKDIVGRVAGLFGLMLEHEAFPLLSHPFKQYILNEELLTILAGHEIIQCTEDLSPITGGKFILRDNNSLKGVWPWPTSGPSISGQWHFSHDFVLETPNPFVSLRIVLDIGDKEENGVIVKPRVFSTADYPNNDISHFRMFRALVKNDPYVPDFAKRLAESRGSIVIPFSYIGLSGIRRLSDIFAEFAGGNKEVKELEFTARVFMPNPWQNCRPEDELFAVEYIQTAIVAEWKRQLKEYRNLLVSVSE